MSCFQVYIDFKVFEGVREEASCKLKRERPREEDDLKRPFQEALEPQLTTSRPATGQVSLAHLLAKGAGHSDRRSAWWRSL